MTIAQSIPQFRRCRVRAAVRGAALAVLLQAPLALADGGLQGVVLQSDARDARSVAVQGARVSVVELGREVQTARDGRFRLNGLKPGRYTVQASYLGVDTQQQIVEVLDERVQQLDFTLAAAVTLEPLLVVGDAAAANEALARQRAADSIHTVVNADAIGNFADANAAEALQRLPGMSIERDQGEGRFVRIRGLGPELNAVTVNGVRVPAPESGTRAVALDVVPTELLESLDVSKALTADQDGEGLGGSVDIKPLSALDRDGLYYRGSAYANYDEHSAQTSPKLALAASNLFDLGAGHRLGVAAGYSFDSRDFGSDNTEAQDHWSFDDGVAALEEFEQRDYELNRERSGWVLNLDYLTPGGQRYFARYLETGFEDTEQRLANTIAFLDADGEDTAVSAGTAAAAAEISRELKKRTETLKVSSIALGADQRWQRWTLGYQLSLSQASEDTPFNIDGATFEGEFGDVGFVSTRQPQPFSSSDINAVDAYALDAIELATTYTEDEDRALRIDLSREFELGRYPAQLSFGAKASRREKTSSGTLWALEDFEDLGFAEDELAMARFATGAVDYDLGQFGPGLNADALMQLARDQRIDLDDAIDDGESALADYQVNEDIDAGYGMLRVDLGELRVLGGLRYEATAFSGRGNELQDGVGADDIVAVRVSKDYTNLLPSLHLRYRLGERLQLRAAATQSLMRPGFEQARPSAIIEEDDGEVSAELGNPALDPTTSSNLDLGLEWYWGRASALTAFVFYKDISDFIYTTDLAGTPGYQSYEGLEISEASIAVNGERAQLLGVEVGLSRQFANGVLIASNVTLSESEATIEAADDGELIGRDIPLPSQSDTTANLVLGFERERYRLRLAANYKSSYLLEVSDPLDAQGDIYEDDHLTIDLTAAWFATRNLQLQLQGLNLNDEPFYSHINGQAYNAQYEEYGPTYRLGLVYTNY